MEKNAFVVYVFGSYEKYIPYYIYFINKNYPDDDILIFYKNEISENVKEACSSFKNYIFYENIYSEHKGPEHKRIKGGGSKLLRWVLPRDYFKNYKYVYVGDVDILILKEEMNLFSFHKYQAEKFNLPFSNRVRPLPEGGLSKRLTGLHFFEVEPYYDLIETRADKILNDKEFFFQYLESIERDEQLLYKLVKDCVGFDENEVVNMERPWHGFHIGVVRGGLLMNKKQIEENSSISFNEIKRQLTEVLSDNNFTSLFINCFCIEAYWGFKQFNIKLPINIIKAYYIFKLKRFGNRIVNKLIR